MLRIYRCKTFVLIKVTFEKDKDEAMCKLLRYKVGRSVISLVSAVWSQREEGREREREREKRERERKGGLWCRGKNQFLNSFVLGFAWKRNGCMIWIFYTYARHIEVEGCFRETKQKFFERNLCSYCVQRVYLS